MTDRNKERLNLALLNAATFISNHGEVGLNPEDINEDDEKGMMEYAKACERASKLITTLAKKYG